MPPWFLATKPFTPGDGAWDSYIKWSGLTELEELVSLDAMMCPSLLEDIQDDYWGHIVEEQFMLHYFLDFDFLMKQVAGIERKNVLCVYRNPQQPPMPAPVAAFEFLGYDLVDVHDQASALTNCGGFPDVFANSELSRFGLLENFTRAAEVQGRLRSLHPGHPHANCHLWAIFRMLPGHRRGG